MQAGTAKQSVTIRPGWTHRLMLIGLCGVMLGSVGCVAQRVADDLETVNRRLQEQILELRGQLEAAEANLRAVQSEPTAPDADTVARLEQAIAERDALRKTLAETEDAIRRLSQVDAALPVELDSALISLAETDPNLMTYDPAIGMVKFASDLTFAAGSVEVSEQAKAGLARLANILARPVAARYEARIVGHTDNVPISRPATRAAHPTNWHLSVHRAIAVKDVLQAAGVPVSRMSVAGYGEHRPIAPNPASGGSQLNRRVEIFLVPSTGRSNTQAAAPASASPARTEASTRAPAPENFK